MGAKLLAIPFGLVFFFILHQIFVLEDHTLSVYLIPLSIILAAIYVLHPQINWWWYKRYPEQSDPAILRLLEKLNPAFRRLDVDSKILFSKRLPLFIRHREFIGKEVKNIQDDLKSMICAYGVLLTLHEDDFLLDHYARIVLYKHPFLSPNHPDTIHVSELESEDGVMIFSLEQLIPGLQDPGRYYNIALHEFARIYLRLRRIAVPDLDLDGIWAKMQASGFPKKENLETWIGLPITSPLPVLIHHYLLYPVRMREKMKEQYDLVRSWIPLSAKPIQSDLQ